MKDFALKVLGASAVMAGLVFILWKIRLVPNELARIAVVGMLGVLVYGSACYVLHVPQARKAVVWARSRFRK